MVTPDKRPIAGNRKPFSTEQAGLAYSQFESPEVNTGSGNCNRDERLQVNNIRVFNDDNTNSQSCLESGLTGINGSSGCEKNPISPSSQLNGHTADYRMNESSNELIIRTQKIQLPENSQFRQEETYPPSFGYDENLLSCPSVSQGPETINSERSYTTDNPFDIADDASERNKRTSKVKAHPNHRLELVQQSSSQASAYQQATRHKRHSSGSNVYLKEQKIKAAQTLESIKNPPTKIKSISKKSSQQDELSQKGRLSRGSSHKKLAVKSKQGSRSRQRVDVMVADVEMEEQADNQSRNVFYASKCDEAMNCLNDKRAEKLDQIAQGVLTFGSQHLQSVPERSSNSQQSSSQGLHSHRQGQDMLNNQASREIRHAYKPPCSPVHTRP